MARYARALLGSAPPMPRDSGPISEVLSGLGGVLPVPGSVPPADIERYIKNYYEKVLWIFRCVDVRATNMSEIDIIIRQGDRHEGRPVRDDQITNLLNIKPNTYESAAQFKYRWSSQADLSTRGVFIELEKDAFGNVVGLHLLPPQSVEPIPDIKTFVGGYRVKLANQAFTIHPPEDIIWIRPKPHPTDPYKAMTPLMQASIIADTDYLARIYNRNFLMNDGRPGLLITIGSLFNNSDADEIKRHFEGGPIKAGSVAVLEGSDVSVNDLSASPRDVQYVESINGSKEDIMLAYGVPESAMGNASDRTFDNADAELEIYWTLSEVPHIQNNVAGIQPLIGDPLTNGLKYLSPDFSKVQVLQRHAQQRHDKILAEFQAGTATADEYRIATGKVPFNVPASRALIFTNGILVGQNQADQEALDKMIPVGARAMPAPGGGGAVPGQLPDQSTSGQQQVTNNSPAALVGSNPNAITASGTSKAAALTAAESMVSSRLAQRDRQTANITSAKSNRLARRTRRGLGTKSYGNGSDFDPDGRLYVIEGQLATDDFSHPYGALRASLEGQFNGALLAWSNRQAEVIPARMLHGKVRKHTRHWEGSGMGTKALDPNYIVETNRWSNDLLGQMAKVLKPVAQRELSKAAKDMDRSGITNVMFRQSLGNSNGTGPLERVFGTRMEIDGAVSSTLNPLYGVINRAAANQSNRVAAKVQQLDQDGASMKDIQSEVNRMISSRSPWHRQLSTYLTTAVVEGSQYAAYSRAGDIMQHEWNTSEDERVRETHHMAALEGPKLGNQPFTVGGAEMPYPGYPSAPINETANCRCWTTWDIAADAEPEYDEYAYGD